MRKLLFIVALMSVLLVAGAYASGGGKRSQGAAHHDGRGVFSMNSLAALLFANPREGVSRITKVNILGRASMGRFDGVRYVRIYGTVEGFVTPRDDVVGFHTCLL